MKLVEAFKKAIKQELIADLATYPYPEVMAKAIIKKLNRTESALERARLRVKLQVLKEMLTEGELNEG